ncbi:TolC family protein, partial [Breznakiellaceae bacterium SP9]
DFQAIVAPTGSSIKMHITQQEAVDLAIKNNLSLKAAEITNATKKRNSDHSWNQFVPSIDVSGSLSYSPTVRTQTMLGPSSGIGAPMIPYMGALPFTKDSPTYWTAASGLSVTLGLNYAMFENMKKSVLDYQSGLISYEKAKAQIERDVRKQYYSVLLLQESLALQKETLASAEKRLTTTQAQYRAGLVPELNVLQATVSRENIKPQISQIENDINIVMAQFAVSLGMPYDSIFELDTFSGTVSDIPLDVMDLINKAAQSKPDVLEIQQSILSLKAAREAAWYSTYTPNLALNFTFNPYANSDFFNQNWFKSESWARSPGRISIGLSYNLADLFGFGAKAQSLLDIDDNIQTLTLNLGQVIRASQVEVFNQILVLKQAQEQIQTQGKTVELAERSNRLTTEAYNNGLQELLQVQASEDALRQAQFGVIQQRFAYLQGLIDLEYAVGVPFGTISSKAF